MAEVAEEAIATLQVLLIDAVEVEGDVAVAKAVGVGEDAMDKGSFASLFWGADAEECAGVLDDLLGAFFSDALGHID